METSIILSASRQSFAFARDGALPFTTLLQLNKVRIPLTRIICLFSDNYMGGSDVTHALD